MINRLRTSLVLLMVPVVASCGGANKFAHEYGAGAKALSTHKYGAAQAHLGEAVALAASNGDKQSYSQALTTLADAYSLQGRFATAEPYYKLALETTVQLNGENSEKTARALGELAACHHQQTDYSFAEPLLLLRALQIRRSLPKKDDLATATTANNLAEIYKKENKDTQALELYQQALQLTSKYTNDPRALRATVETLNNLAMFYRKEEQFAEATTTANRALSLLKDHQLNASMPRAMASTLNTLAAIDRAQYDYAGAEKLYQQSLATLKNAKTAEDLVCDTYDSYGGLLVDQDKDSDAQRIFVLSLNSCVQAHGDEHPLVAERLCDLAKLSREERRYDQAEAYLKRALRINQRSFDADSPIVFQTINQLSAVYMDQKKYDLAEGVYKQWVPTLKSVLGKSHPHVADALDNWAMIAKKAQDDNLAAALQQEAKDIRLSHTASQPHKTLKAEVLPTNPLR